MFSSSAGLNISVPIQRRQYQSVPIFCDSVEIQYILIIITEGAL